MDKIRVFLIQWQNCHFCLFHQYTEVTDLSLPSLLGMCGTASMGSITATVMVWPNNCPWRVRCGMGSYRHDWGAVRLNFFLLFSFCLSGWLYFFPSHVISLSLTLSWHINELIIIYWQQESNAEDIVMQSSVNKIQLLRKKASARSCSSKWVSLITATFSLWLWPRLFIVKYKAVTLHCWANNNFFFNCFHFDVATQWPSISRNHTE